MEELAEAGIRVEEEQTAVSEFSMESGYEAAKRLLTARPDIDTLLCATDSIAAGAKNYLSERGLKIPEDIQLAGFGDSPIARVMTPPVTTVHFHYKTSGEEATRLLLNLIRSRGNSPQREIKLGYYIVEHASFRPKT